MVRAKSIESQLETLCVTQPVFKLLASIPGNSLVGILYGWCYWRLSFIAAVIAHFSVDLIIHAVPAPVV